MTRLQNAKKQLSEALAVLESAVSKANSVSCKAGSSGYPSQADGQTTAGADLSALVDEVSMIEAKLSEAIAMIASVDPGTSTNGDKR